MIDDATKFKTRVQAKTEAVVLPSFIHCCGSDAAVVMQ